MLSLININKASSIKKAAFSTLLGCISALAMAPASLWPVLLTTISLFFAILNSCDRKKHAYLIGSGFAFGYFLCSLSWIGSALLVEGNGYKWAYPVAISGIPLLLSVYWGLAAALWIEFKNRTPSKTLLHTLSFVIIFTSAEIARSTLFTGFPWNLFAYSWVNQIEIIQICYLISAYGLTALTWLWALTPYALWTLKTNKKQSLLLIFIITTTFGASHLYGYNRLKTAPPQQEKVNIKIVAGNIEQSEKWKREKLFDNFMHYIKLSHNQNTPPPSKPTLIVWPETAMIDWYYKDKGINGIIKEMLSSYPNGATLITGALRHNTPDTTQNSIVMIDNTGKIQNIYDKTHLVPFGEYIPFQQYINLSPVNNFSGFTKGKGPQTYKTPYNIKYIPAVCYEIIFPYALTYSAAHKPDYILNTTNDAWYQGSAGPSQHHAQVIFRAIEYNLPIIRVANMGISAIVDTYGRMQKK